VRRQADGFRARQSSELPKGASKRRIQAASICSAAVSSAFTGAGGTAIYDKNPLQRAFRDIHAANAHYMLSWDVNMPLYGRVALGLSPDVAL